MATREAEGDGWCLEVEDDQRKLGQWVELLTGPMKKYGWEYEMVKKVGEGIITGQNGKEKGK
jgi:hypothetical protein